MEIEMTKQFNYDDLPVIQTGQETIGSVYTGDYFGDVEEE